MSGEFPVGDSSPEVYQFRGDWVESSVTEIDRAPATTASVATGDWPFKPYVKEGLKIKVMAGTIDGRLAGNWNAEITLPPDKEYYWCYLKVNLNARGEVTSSEYKVADAPPVNPLPGSNGSLPGTVYVPLFGVDTGEESVTAFYPLQKTNLTVSVGISQSGCSTAYRTLSIE